PSTYSLSLHDALPICLGDSAAHAPVDGFPLEPSVGGDEAPPTSERVTERGFLRGRLRPRVDHAVADRRVLGPKRHEPPTHHPETADGGLILQHRAVGVPGETDRKSTRLNSSHVKISYAVFCLKKK